MSVRLIIAKYGYWGEHPDYPAEDWRHLISSCDSRLGYWDWVRQQLQEVDHEG